MTEVTAYHNPNAPIHRQWIAYVVMDNGNLWGVYATATLEWQAKEKIRTLWESERQKVARINSQPAGLAFQTAMVGSQPEGEKANPWASETVVKEHHLKGMVWLIHKVNRTKCRVSADAANHMMGTGDWERGGPRSR